MSGATAAAVIAGPVVRRVEPGQVSVWIALSAPARVALRVFDDHGQELLAGQTQTRALGAALHIALVTATGPQSLAWNSCYQYEIELDGASIDLEGLLYEHGPGRLSFMVPGATLEDTRIAHGSCRHPTNRGRDALGLLDALIERSVSTPAERPQLFVCSGDLIYADSPSPSLLQLVGELGERLLGYREVLPGLDCSAAEIPLGDRQRIAGEQAAIYAATRRQLFGLGEFFALNLLVLSPSLWPASMPDDLRPFHASLASVRRALANTAFYAIFDDHEITDDWYLTRTWSERVLGAPLGRRMIANGLAAFAVVHGWGNTPEQFAAGEVGHRIVDELCAQKGVSDELEAMLGMPETVGDALQPPAGSLRWHFRVQTPAVDLRALDTRTMRAFPEEDPHARPDLLSAAAIAEQLDGFTALPVLIVPAPLAPPPRTRAEQFTLWLDNRFRRGSRVERQVYMLDRGDEWQPTSTFFARILDALPPTWVCLGGDTHIAYAAMVEQAQGNAAIFCSSGMLRETTARRIRQALGFSYPWPVSREPVIMTMTMALRYLTSAADSVGKRYQYLAKNNIGELRFSESALTVQARHKLYWQDASGSIRPVAHTVALSK